MRASAGFRLPATDVSAGHYARAYSTEGHFPRFRVSRFRADMMGQPVIPNEYMALDAIGSSGVTAERA